MGKKCYRMRSRACEKKLKRRRLFGERHFLDADARLNQMGERDAGDEAFHFFWAARLVSVFHEHVVRVTV